MLSNHNISLMVDCLKRDLERNPGLTIEDLIKRYPAIKTDEWSRIKHAILTA